MTSPINQNSNTSSAYKNLKQWEENKDILSKVQNKLSSEGFEVNSDSSVFSYDFMQGKSADNKEDYNNRLLELGKADVLAMDTNKDGVVDISEFAIAKTNNYNGSTKEVSEKVAEATLLFDAMDNIMGNSDKSGTLSAEEFASYYENLDKFKENENGEAELSSVRDGKIDPNSEEILLNFLKENFPNDYETYKSTTEAAFISEDDKKLYASYKKLLNAHAELDAQYANKDLTDAEYAEYLKKEEEIGLEFDFMQGKDPNNIEDYNLQTLALAKGDVFEMDKNNDKRVSLEEYVDYDLSGIEFDSVEEKAEAAAMSELTFRMIDSLAINENEDSNSANYKEGDGLLDSKEIAQYYQDMDGVQMDKITDEYYEFEVSSNASTGNFDGKINLSDMGFATMAMIENYLYSVGITEEEQNEIKEKYIEKYSK